MKKNFLLQVLSVSIVASLGSACVSIPMSSPTEDSEAKKFEAHVSQSRIYLFRQKGFKGSAAKFPVSLNSQLKGQSASGVFFVWDVAPGKHEIFCAGSKNATLSLNTKAGELYFVEQKFTDEGFSGPGCVLAQVDKKRGEAEVRKCNLAQSND